MNRSLNGRWALLAVLCVATMSGPLPAGSASTTRGIVLMRAPASLRQTCATAAAEARRQHSPWKVACPSRVPFTLTPSFALYGDGGVGDLRPGYTIDCVGFTRTGHVHWDLDAGDPTILGLQVRNAVGQPQDTVRRLRTLKLGGQAAALYHVSWGEGPATDQIVVAWTRQGEAYRVTVFPFAYNATSGIGEAVAETQATSTARSLIDQLTR